MQREQLEQLLSSSIMLRSTFLMLYLKEDNVEAFFHITWNRTPYPWAHIPERVLSKGDCVESGYSEVIHDCAVHT